MRAVDPRGAAAPQGLARTVGLGLSMAAAGAAQTLGFVHTAWAGWPFLIALSVLVAALNRANPRTAAVLGWCWGTGWLAAGVWWLFVSMHRYGGLPAPLAVAAVFCLAAALALYLALACWAYARWRTGRPALDGLLFLAVWLLAELARALLFTGFPWVASGYAFVDAPLAVLAPWVGVYGMGAVAAGLVAWALAGRRGASPAGWGSILRPVVAVVFLMVVGARGPVGFTQATGSLRVTLLQTNVQQDEKFAVERMPDSLAWLAHSVMQAQGELVVAPETAVPLLPGQLESLSPGYWQQLEQHVVSSRRYALIGLPLGDFESGYSNSVAGLGGSAAFRYDKHHLVPFGEFIPTGFRWFTQLMNIPLGDFMRGPLDSPPFEVRGQRVAPNICYEDLFGEELAVRFVDPARAPTIMANISNIGWFDDTAALPQHLNISRMRSLEFQRPMLRATNTGVTAIIDHQGRVTAQAAPLTRTSLEGAVEGRQGLTPYAQWVGRTGLWPVAAAAMLVVVWVARRGSGVRRRL